VTQEQPRKAVEPVKVGLPKVKKVPTQGPKSKPEARVNLTVKEVSILLNKSKNALEHMRRAGKGPAFFKENGKILYDWQSVDHFMGESEGNKIK
jgi:hypothetical protein